MILAGVILSITPTNTSGKGSNIKLSELRILDTHLSLFFAMNKLIDFPVLTEHRILRLITVTAMYFAQGIQTGLLITAIPAYLANQKVDATSIGSFISIVMLPWTFKLISAPLMDRFSFLPMGRRRPWVILGMLGAIIGYLVMSFVPNPVENIPNLLAAGLIVSFFTAFMDVAIDGMTIDIIEIEEYANANAFMNGGNVIGFALTSALATWLMNHYGLSHTLFIVAIVMGLLALFPILLRERSGERIFPWSVGKAADTSLKSQTNSWRAIGKNLFRVLFLPASTFLLLICVLHGTTYGFMQAFLPTLTVQELEWTDTRYSNLVATAGLVAGILGMFLADASLEKIGVINGLKVFLITLIIIAILIGLLPLFWKTGLTMQIFIFSYYIIRTLLLITLFTVCMIICWEVVAATQFTLYMSFSNLGISIGAALFSWLKSFLAYTHLFFVFSGILLVALLVLTKIDLSRHKKTMKYLDTSI